MEENYSVPIQKKKKKSLKNKLKSYNDVATDFHDVEMPNLL